MTDNSVHATNHTDNCENQKKLNYLKSCPFCGSTYLYCYYYDVGNFGDPVDPCVVCNGCGLVIKFHGPQKYKMGMDDIRKVWNRRV